MTRKGYYHGDKFIAYKRGNLAGKYGPSSKNSYAKKRFIILEMIINLKTIISPTINLKLLINLIINKSIILPNHIINLIQNLMILVLNLIGLVLQIMIKIIMKGIKLEEINLLTPHQIAMMIGL